MSDLPTLPTIVVPLQGLTPQSPASLRAQLVAIAVSTDPGLTTNLPGTLIEDLASTSVAALYLCDSARVGLINSLNPLASNQYLLQQLGNIYIGVGPNAATNTSVYVEFSTDPPAPGFIINPGFLVSDGTYQYTVTDGGAIGSSGTSDTLSAVATQAGTWAVPASSVNQLVTSVPITINLSVTNPLAGTPGLPAEDWDAYRAQVLQAGLAASQGSPRYLKTLLYLVPGVQQRLVSVRQVPGFGWEVIVGGGDQYAIANAIFQGLGDISTLVGSVMNVINITNADPGVVTTGLNHGLLSGTIAVIRGIVGMTELNGVPLTITALTANTFSTNVDTRYYAPWTSGGVVTPNPRNIVVSLDDYPDTYSVPFVIPPQQVITMVATWNTSDANFISAGSVAQLATPALIDYINSIPVGQPIITYVLASTFQAAVSTVLPSYLLTALNFAVSINGSGVLPVPGTGEIISDPESYFYTQSGSVVVVQG